MIGPTVVDLELQVQRAEFTALVQILSPLNLPKLLNVTPSVRFSQLVQTSTVFVSTSSPERVQLHQTFFFLNIILLAFDIIAILDFLAKFGGF